MSCLFCRNRASSHLVWSFASRQRAAPLDAAFAPQNSEGEGCGYDVGRLAKGVEKRPTGPDRGSLVIKNVARLHHTARDATPLKRHAFFRENPCFVAMVPRRRLELPRPCGHWHLKPARLPIPPPGQASEDGGDGLGAARQLVNAEWRLRHPPIGAACSPPSFQSGRSRLERQGSALSGASHLGERALHAR